MTWKCLEFRELGMMQDHFFFKYIKCHIFGYRFQGLVPKTIRNFWNFGCQPMLGGGNCENVKFRWSIQPVIRPVYLTLKIWIINAFVHRSRHSDQEILDKLLNLLSLIWPISSLYQAQLGFLIRIGHSKFEKSALFSGTELWPLH